MIQAISKIKTNSPLFMGNENTNNNVFGNNVSLNASFNGIDQDTVCFKYKALKSDSDLRSVLKREKDKLGIYDVDKATIRIHGTSEYLKKMIGYIPPNNIAAKEWFELGCEYLIKGSAGVSVPEQEYYKYAKDFWTLMAKADPYWKNPGFINYLKGMNRNPAVNATIKVLEDINRETAICNLFKKASFMGYKSSMTEDSRLLKDGCPYTGDYYSGQNRPSLDHILPHCAVGDAGNIDYNFIVSGIQANTTRGDIPLTDFLKGWDCNEFQATFPHWRENLINDLIRKYKLSDDDIIPYISYKTTVKANSQPNPNLLKALKDDLIISNKLKHPDIAAQRVQNLSNYLIKMVGFVPPGGEVQWFENACRYLLLGSVGTSKIPKDMYPELAEELWTVISKADDYWTSDAFIRFLESINNNISVNATIKAIKNIKARNKDSYDVSFTGGLSDLRLVKDLLKACAYSGEEMSLIKGDDYYPTVEHILPQNVGGGSNDYNYMLTKKSHNNDRSNIPMLEYLLGWNADEFRQAHPNWKLEVFERVKEFHRRRQMAEASLV